MDSWEYTTGARNRRIAMDKRRQMVRVSLFVVVTVVLVVAVGFGSYKDMLLGFVV